MSAEEVNAVVTGPLATYRVLDLTDESGVYGTKLLAALGAEVIKIEPPEGDRQRRLPPLSNAADGSERSLFFAYMNTNKYSITLNMESDEGRRLFQRLAGLADALFDTATPGYWAERGIGYEQLSQSNPRLVWVSLTPFGLTGPRRHWKGSDLTAWASSGVLYSNGFPDQPPMVPGGDLMLGNALGAINAAVGCLVALQSRERTGRGQLVDVSLQESLIVAHGESSMPAFLDDSILRMRYGNRRPYAPPLGLFPCKDGYVQLIIGQPAHWPLLAAWIKEKTGDESVSDPLYEDRLIRVQLSEQVEAATERLTGQYTKQEFFVEAQRRGIPCGPANTIADLFEDAQLEARDYWVNQDHPVLGRVRMAGAPYRFSKTPWRAGRAPLLGEHNELVYGQRLGVDSAELAALRARGVI